MIVCIMGFFVASSSVFFVFRLVYEVDPKLANSGTFRILKEDHTIGHLLQMFVSFVHPL